VIYISAPCPLCGEAGVIGFLRTSDPERIVLSCDECSSIWIDPENITLDSALGATGPDHKVRPFEFTTIFPGSGWATKTEIQAAGLEHLIAGEQHD
jgi:hypothetical protein